MGLSKSNDKPRRLYTPGEIRWSVLRRILALLLAIAASYKTLHQHEILVSDGLLSAPLILYPVIVYELAIACFLILGSAFWGWCLAITTFSTFSVATTIAILLDKDCGCFGELIAPQWMLPLDLLCVATILCAKPRHVKRGMSRELITLSISFVVALLFFGVFLITKSRTTQGELEYLLADDLIGQQWPINNSFAPRLEEMDDGNWLVLIVRRDCLRCQQLIQREFADPSTCPSGMRTAMFVAGDSVWPFHFDNVSLPGDFEPIGEIVWTRKEPFIASPLLLVLSNGIVTTAADGMQAEEELTTLLDPVPSRSAVEPAR